MTGAEAAGAKAVAASVTGARCAPHEEKINELGISGFIVKVFQAAKNSSALNALNRPSKQSGNKTKDYREPLLTPIC